MSDKLQNLKNLLAEHGKVSSISALVQWDQETNMPEDAGAFRSEQIAYLSSLAHELHTGSRFRKTLAEYADPETGEPVRNDLSADEQRFVDLVWNDYHLASAIPADFVEDFSRLTSQSQQAWIKARKADDFTAFQPYLEKIVDMVRKQADYLGWETTPYDALLKQYEPGMTAESIAAVFDEMKTGLISLLKAVESGDAPDDAILRESFDTDTQWKFGLEVVNRMGYDMKRGRQDRSAHPFTTGFHPTDVRITTRVFEHDVKSAFFSTVHEAGHALYEQGLPAEWFGTPFGQAASYGIHESQSRLWENLVGRSLGFWKYFYPRFVKLFPRMKDIPVEEFYRMINTVNPSLIRVEADEVTYSLHIMLRFEIEKMLINDGLSVRELPELWNAKMKEYLGVVPPNNADGVMQDVHWPMGAIGYFPSYALGNVYGAQFMERMQADCPEMWPRAEAGDFSPVLGWLRRHVHAEGRRYDPADLVRHVCGEPVSPKAFIRYLTEKYGKIYRI